MEANGGFEAEADGGFADAEETNGGFADEVETDGGFMEAFGAGIGGRVKGALEKLSPREGAALMCRLRT
jgi:hypothetical protein